MNKFKAILRKDWIINKKALLMPFWITLGFYVFVILSSLIALIRGDFQMNLEIFRSFDISEFSPTFIYFINYSVSFFPELMGYFFVIIISQNALNEDIRRNYELFHRSQPVSIWLRSFSKFFIGIGGVWPILATIIAFNLIIVNVLLAIYGRCDVGLALIAAIQSFVKFMIVSLLLGSMAFFSSSIFKDRAVLKSLAVLSALHLLFLIVNVWFGWKLVPPIQYLAKLLRFDSMEPFHIQDVGFDVYNYIKMKWYQILLNWKILLQIGVSALLFVSGTLIYKHKEVK